MSRKCIKDRQGLHREKECGMYQYFPAVKTKDLFVICSSKAICLKCVDHQWHHVSQVDDLLMLLVLISESCENV